MDFLKNHVEALIFCSPNPIREAEIQSCLAEMFGSEVPAEDIRAAIGLLQEQYRADQFCLEIVHSGGGYQFMTKPAYQVSIGILLKQQSKKRLSTSALETLSIVAYRQPVTKSDIEKIRGVNCDYSIQRLLEKQLIEIRGKSQGVGRPLIYGTTGRFMEYFGINDLKELPTLRDINPEPEENVLGTEPD